MGRWGDRCPGDSGVLGSRRWRRCRLGAHAAAEPATIRRSRRAAGLGTARLRPVAPCPPMVGPRAQCLRTAPRSMLRMHPSRATALLLAPPTRSTWWSSKRRRPGRPTSSKHFARTPATSRSSAPCSAHRFKVGSEDQWPRRGPIRSLLRRLRLEQRPPGRYDRRGLRMRGASLWRSRFHFGCRRLSAARNRVRRPGGWQRSALWRLLRHRSAGRHGDARTSHDIFGRRDRGHRCRFGCRGRRHLEYPGPVRQHDGHRRRTALRIVWIDHRGWTRRRAPRCSSSPTYLRSRTWVSTVRSANFPWPSGPATSSSSRRRRRPRRTKTRLTTAVVRFHPSDDSASFVTELQGRVVGAAVSSCAMKP